ncbi:hypothetical protein [Pseudomonas sp. NFR16]|uniref:hypothetical protein n=1 Tax=Pseudomonas sp. NFR16 TaxID=1566248 RepID=UPI0008ABCD25|nr:hypothetical protein [Pseudomonas sp. NFR16]SEJ50930.1 hypothetical protein SAMN03159495_3503 [Pseudomonas sp. NFR16]
MAVSLKKLEHDELPADYLAENATTAFQVTSDAGEVFVVDTEEEAAAIVTRLHVEDQQQAAKD